MMKYRLHRITFLFLHIATCLTGFHVLMFVNALRRGLEDTFLTAVATVFAVGSAYLFLVCIGGYKNKEQYGVYLWQDGVIHINTPFVFIEHTYLNTLHISCAKYSLLGISRITIQCEDIDYHLYMSRKTKSAFFQEVQNHLKVRKNTSNHYEQAKQKSI